MALLRCTNPSVAIIYNREIDPDNKLDFRDSDTIEVADDVAQRYAEHYSDLEVVTSRGEEPTTTSTDEEE